MRQRQKTVSSLLKILMPARFRAQLESWLSLPAFSPDVNGSLPFFQTQVEAESLGLEKPEVKNGLSVPDLSAQITAVPASRRTDLARTSIPVPSRKANVKEIDFSVIRAGGPVQTRPLLPFPAVKDGLARVHLRTGGVCCPSLLVPSRRIAGVSTP